MSLLLPDSGLLFWMLLSFGVVFVVLAKYGFPVITKMVEGRRTYIDQSLEVARQANIQLAKLKEESEALIAAANKEQGRIMREAMHERDKIIIEARKHAEAVAQKELDDVKFREIRAKSALHEELLHRECQHLVRFYMDLCEKDKNYNSVLCGLITIKKDSAKAKLQRDIYETAILLPQEIGLEEDLDLLTKAAREMYELQFPGERLPE